MKVSFKILFFGLLLSVGFNSYAQFILPENFNKGKTGNTTTTNTAEQSNEVQGDVVIKVRPTVRNAVFHNPNSVTYVLSLKNDYKVSQEGTVDCFVTTDLGERVYTETLPAKMSKMGSQSFRFHVKCYQPGFYKIGFAMHLTYYDDTVKRVFGLNPEALNTRFHKPLDFDDFWRKTQDSLKKIDPQFKVTLEKSMSINNKSVYLVEMHSFGNAVIRGWLSIPHNKPKRIPVKYRLPGYVVRMEPSLDDDDFAVFNLNVRGNGNSKDAIDTHGEYNLYHIDNRDEYVYRAVYMDCIRGLDFLCSQNGLGLDTTRIMVDGASQGGGLAIALAALDKRVKLATVEVPLYADFRKAYEITKLNPKSQTPVGMITRYVREHPNFTEEQLFKIWDYYDPLNFAPAVKCPVLMGIGLLDEFCPPQCSYVMYNQMHNSDNEVWASPDKTHEVDALYYTYQYLWFQDLLRLP